MKNYLQLIEQRLIPPLTKLSEQKHLRSVRDGIISVLPLILTGSFFLMLGQLPLDFLKNPQYPSWIINSITFYDANLVPKLLIPYRLTMGLMALYAAFGIAYNLGKTYELDGLSVGILSTSSFLLTILPVKAIVTNEKAEWVIPIDKLGGKGLFVAILCAFITVEITRFLLAKKLSFSMPEGVPPAVINAFTSLVPGIVVLTVIWVLQLTVDIHTLLGWILSPLVKTGDGFVAIILINLLLHLIWITGIHGASVINAVAFPFWMQFLEENAAAHASGTLLPHITSLPFYQWFIWIGGSGTTLSLIIMMVFSRSAYLKKLGRISILPSIFNINEPIIFGLPVVMNPVIAIPFVIAPIVSGIIAFIAVKTGLVQSPYIMVPWTLPAPIGALASTGFDWRALMLVIINIIISGLIYYPFFKSIERKTIEKENSSEV
ncbi:MAG: Lichenan permease IIC component [bacterium ADurb.Bin363]|nr:MAG: Lichenan permease IIC component [bacterium ADurb.Bin363]